MSEDLPSVATSSATVTTTTTVATATVAAVVTVRVTSAAAAAGAVSSAVRHGAVGRCCCLTSTQEDLGLGRDGICGG